MAQIQQVGPNLDTIVGSPGAVHSPTASIQQTQPDPGPALTDMQRLYAALGRPYNALGNTGLNQVTQRSQNGSVDVNDVQAVQCEPQTLNRIQAQQTQPQTQVQLRPIGPGSTASAPDNALGVQNEINIGLALLQEHLNHLYSSATVFQDVLPWSPSSTKNWHQSVTPDIRHELMKEITRVLFPNASISSLHDIRLAIAVAYAQLVEGRMYETANSREEYFQLLSEKIYKIQKELEEKHQKRKEQRTAQFLQVGHNLAAAIQQTQPDSGPEMADMERAFAALGLL